MYYNAVQDKMCIGGPFPLIAVQVSLKHNNQATTRTRKYW